MLSPDVAVPALNFTMVNKLTTCITVIKLLFLSLFPRYVTAALEHYYQFIFLSNNNKVTLFERRIHLNR